MTNLDVSLRIRFSKIGDGAKAAEKDLKSIKDAADKLGTRSGAAKLGSDLAKVGAGAKTARREIGDLKSATDRLGTGGGGARAAEDIKLIGYAARKSRTDLVALAEAQRRLSGGGAGGGRGGSRGGGGGTQPPGGGHPAPGGGAVVGGAAAAGALAPGMLAPIGIGFGVKKAWDQSVNVDAAWAEVLKKINDASPEQFVELEGAIRRVSLELGIGRAQLMGLVAEAGAAGIAFKDLMEFMRLTGKTAIGWDMQPREASQKLAFIKAATAKTIAEMDLLANKINALADNASASERDLLDMYLKVGQAAAESGVGEDTTLAMLTAVRSGGMEPEVVARWFSAFAGGLRTAELAPPRVEAGLVKLGLTAKQVADGMKTDAEKTILDIFDRLGKSPDAAEAATQIFGREWWDETLRAKKGIAEIQKQLEFIKNPANYQGSLDKNLVTQLATARNHIEKMNELVSRIGEGLTRWSLGPFNAVIDEVTSKLVALDTRASIFEQKAEEERARKAFLGDGAPTGGPKAESWLEGAGAWVKKNLWGDDQHGDFVYEWIMGRAGGREDQLKEAKTRGEEAAKAEAIARVRTILGQKERLTAQKNNPAFPDQEGIAARIGSLDEKLRKALESPNLGPIAREEMEKYAQAITSEGEKATDAARKIAEELTRILSITAHPTISPIGPPPSGADGPPGGATPGKQSSLSGPTVVHQHINGADPARVARAAQREQDRAIRSARAGALHDLGSNWA